MLCVYYICIFFSPGSIDFLTSMTPFFVIFPFADAIATKRFDAQTGADREVQRILLELLNQMDGFDQQTNVKVCLCIAQSTILLCVQSTPLFSSFSYLFSSFHLLTVLWCRLLWPQIEQIPWILPCCVPAAWTERLSFLTQTAGRNAWFSVLARQK
jgi:hypothetical protein